MSGRPLAHHHPSLEALRAAPLLVASDLDRTLIYSAAALGLAMPDAEAPGSCVSRHTSASRCPI